MMARMICEENHVKETKTGKGTKMEKFKIQRLFTGNILKIWTLVVLRPFFLL